MKKINYMFILSQWPKRLVSISGSNLIFFTRVIILSGLFFNIVSCSSSESKKTAKENFEAENYKIISVEARKVSENIKLPGVLEPFEFVQIYPKVNGFIRDIMVDRGSNVHKGQIMMSLDAPELSQKLSSDKLKYMQSLAVFQTSRDHYNRLLQTSKTPGTVSQYDLQAAYSKMIGDSATMQGEMANYQAQETMISYLTVSAPFDGVITERNVHPGALVGPGSQSNGKPMLVLQQQNKLRLVINLPEEYSTQVTDGSIVHFHVNALPGHDFKGTISRSSGTLSEKFRAETIEVDVPNPERLLKAGMYVEAIIPAPGNAMAFKVPNTAIVTTTERKYVVTVKNNKARLVDISEGNKDADTSEVFGKLTPDDKIIANANYTIDEGKTISSKP